MARQTAKRDESYATHSSCPTIKKRAYRRGAAQVFAASPQKLSPPVLPPACGRGQNGRATFKRETAGAVSRLKAAPRANVRNESFSCQRDGVSTWVYNGALRQQSNLLFQFTCIFPLLNSSAQTILPLYFGISLAFFAIFFPLIFTLPASSVKIITL